MRKCEHVQVCGELANDIEMLSCPLVSSCVSRCFKTTLHDSDTTAVFIELLRD